MLRTHLLLPFRVACLMGVALCSIPALGDPLSSALEHPIQNDRGPKAQEDGSVSPSYGENLSSSPLHKRGDMRKTSSKKDLSIPYMWVVLGDYGQPIVRAIVEEGHCPFIMADGKKMPLKVRASVSGKGHISSLDKSATFPLTCEALLPMGVKRATLQGRPLPLPLPAPKRIVIIGDTGCRIKPYSFQACNDPQRFPYAHIAKAAAHWKPDLVIHTGDYHYREAKCPPTVPGCSGSPSGYGYVTWKADFFEPSRPLFETAPWVMVRGNHETCHRAGEGWWRYLAPYPMPGRVTCTSSSTVEGDVMDAYRIPVGEGAQLIVWDSSYETDSPLLPHDPLFHRYARIYDQLGELARRARHSIALAHHPMLGARMAQTLTMPTAPALGIQSVFRTKNLKLFPEGIDILVGGHVHLWQQVSFQKDLPSQLTVGNSGSLLEPWVLPHPLPADMKPYGPDAPLETFMSLEQEFGFTTLERQGPTRWLLRSHGINGGVLRTCTMEGRRSWCAHPKT